MAKGAFNFNKLLPSWAKKSTSLQPYTLNPSTYRGGNRIHTDTFFIDGEPVYVGVNSGHELLKCYETNPIVKAIIDLKADAFSNMKIHVRDLSSGDEIPLEDYTSESGKLKELLSNPNPLDTGKEWLKKISRFKSVFGNSYTYASVPLGYEERFTYKDINSLQHLAPYDVEPELTDNYLEATIISEIIRYYQITTLNGYTFDVNPSKIMHIKESNLRLDCNYTKGVSKLTALREPISNIKAAYESINVLLKRRGALGVLSADKKDGVAGNIEMTKEERNQVQKDYNQSYGMMANQNKLLISPYPLNYQKMAMNVKELQLREGIASDTMPIAQAFGVPEGLVPQYIKSGGLATENNNLEKRLYDSTIIPEANDYMESFNTFLKLRESGIEIFASYDHVKVLQANKKEEAEVENKKEQTYRDAFRNGAITYDDYLMNGLGMESNSVIGSKYITDLTPEELQAIGVNVNTLQNENNGEE